MPHVEQRIDRIAVIGLGKLGAVLAGCYARSGFHVTGVDVDPRVVEKVRAGLPPVSEPGIDALYRSSAGRLTATLDLHQAVRDSDATLLVVPTPSLEDGSYSLAFALDCCRAVGEALRHRTDRHLVVMKSTVLPGACDAELIPALEAASGLRCGEGFGFSYNPEFIALGNVIHNIFHPELVLIGESQPSAGTLVHGLHRRLLDSEPPAERMSVVNAELAKLAVNTFVTAKITFANSLARLCERLPGGDVDVVTTALGRDSRIGSRYLRGGLGFGGPCFPRDNRALLALARRLGVPFQMAEATDASNGDPAFRVAELIRERVAAGGRVGLLGLSYKPDTRVVERSQAVLIAQLLTASGLEVTVFDPMAIDLAREELGDQVKYAESAQACIDDVDAVAITTPWPEFRELDYASASGRLAFVLDCWGLLSGPERPANLVRLGVGS